jgi:GAF domain-containing protein
MEEHATQLQNGSSAAETHWDSEQSQELRRRDAILTSVALAAEGLLTSENLEHDIATVLAHLGQAMDADRVYLFEALEDATGMRWMRLRHEWTSPGTEPTGDSDEPSALSETILPRWLKRLGEDRVLHGHTRDFPADERKALEAQNVQSVLVMPIIVETDEWGLLGFDYCREDHYWFLAEIDALQAAAGTIGAALFRWQAEKTRRESEQIIRRRQQELTKLHELAAAIGQSLDLESVTHTGLAHALALLDGPARGALFLLDSKAKLLRLSARQGFDSTFAKLNATVPLDDRLCGQAAIRGMPQVITDVTDLRHTRPPLVWQWIHMAIPLKYRDRVTGVLCVYVEGGRP